MGHLFPLRTTILAPLLALLLGSIAIADGSVAPNSFRFGAEAAKARAADEAAAQSQADDIARLVSTPCQQRLKNKKILQLVAQQSADGYQTSQEQYAPFFNVIDSRLRALGLKTYTQQQIRQTIAQAEIKAYFNNDPDAALAASSRFSAEYILRGTISTRTSVNPVVQVNEVAVSVDLTLADARGRILSEVGAHSESYSGQDIRGTAFALIRTQADRLVAELYNDYCRKASGS